VLDVNRAADHFVWEVCIVHFVEPAGTYATTGGCCGDGEVALIRMP
jgi:hypothetical protein